MGDVQLRVLERRFQACGSPEDEEAWLRAQVRAGALSEDHLRLAAYLGHPGARATTSWRAPLPPPRRARKFIEILLATWGKRVVVYTAFTAARVGRLFGAREEPSEHAYTLRALAAARAWLDRPCLEHHEAASDIGHEPVDPYASLSLVSGAARAAVLAVAANPWVEEPTLDAFRLAAEAIDRARDLDGETTVRRSVEYTLARWVLGGERPAPRDLRSGDSPMEFRFG